MNSQAHLPLVLPNTTQQTPGYDEAFDPDGKPRDHWAAFMAQYQLLSGAGLQDRLNRARQLTADAGLSLGYHSGSRDQPHWLFDVMPLIITGPEWRQLEAAIQQRARVLDHLLADLYGPQETLRRGLFPPYLVYGNPNYLRPLRHVDEPVKQRRQLSVYAVDLVRRPDGQWTIVADRTQVPTGAGYALANRRVLARAMPEVFTNQAVRSCREFFEHWRQALHSLPGEAAGPNPRVALLTPGPFAPGYFEHVYLAREMNVTLVEGPDLTVRDDQLLLKELGGLQRIDVLLRRLDGDYADPLELRPDSLLGVTGLAQMQRTGQVAMANTLGSGAIETPALFPFLPRLCQELLGETQQAISAETWWCGQPAILRKVIDRFDDYIILPSFYGEGYPVDPAALSPSGRAALIDDMRKAPERYVAQERLVPSVAPMIAGKSIQSSPVVLRLFAIAEGDGYRVMPGGFARLPVSGSPFSGILADGSITKDVWVLDDAAEPTVQYPLPITVKNLDLVRSTGGLQSRVADNLFWLGRHMARIDVSMRMLRAVYARLLNAKEGSAEWDEIHDLSRLFWAHGLVPWDKPITPDGKGTIPEFLLQATSSDGPLQSDFAQAYRLMMGLRDRCSADMWDVLSEFTGPLADRLDHATGDLDLSLDVFDEVLQRGMAFGGMVAEGMVRGAGWSFLQFGRRLEYACYGLRTVQACFGGGMSPDRMHMRLALELGDAMITYRNRYLSVLQPRPVLDLLLNDDTNPRAVRFHVEAMERHTETFPYRRNISPASDLQGLKDSLSAMVDLFRAEQHPGADESLQLDSMIFELEQQLMNISDDISKAFFMHSEGERVLGADWRPAAPVEGGL